MPTNSGMIAANAERWTKAHIHYEWQKAIDETADRLSLPENIAHFKAVEKNDGVIWPVVAVIKEREAGADPAFKKNIAQGDAWISRSTHVPAGRGPFVSWEAAAHDALVDCAPFAARWRDWSIGGALTILEKYNGIGYASKGLPSPYVWSATDQYVKGKYVRDGVFDPNFVDRQIGCAALLIALQKRDPSIKFSAPGMPPRPTVEPPAIIIDNATKAEKQVRAGSAAAGTAAGATEATKDHTDNHSIVHSVATYSVIGLAVALFIVTTIMIGRKVKAINDIW